MSPVRVLRLAVRCPNRDCMVPPRLRTPAESLQRIPQDDPELILLTYECQSCGTVYEIRARHFLYAS